MKVLVLGGGGREHALVWALRHGTPAVEVVCAPGNAGIAAEVRCVACVLTDNRDIVRVVEAEAPHLVVVGPEVPLAAGIVDELTRRNVRVFGPTQAAAQLETSKSFAKDFMHRWQIPTAAYRVCHSSSEVQQQLAGLAAAVVVKADGLAAGKGVVLCSTHAEALQVASQMFDGTLLGSPAASLVLEETLTGPELSFFALCDGETARTLAFAQDHKRVGEGDTGPNTGGMGAYSTDNLVDREMSEWLRLNVAQRVVDGMRAEGTPFSGVLFTGLMMTPDGPRILEFNTRFGDPETEAILLRLETPLLDLLQAAVDGRIADHPIALKPGASACVVAASGGYPGVYPAGKVISGLDQVSGNVKVFHAGTSMHDGHFVTSGGRVLAVSATGADLSDALSHVYAALAEITFDGMQYRRDIGWRALDPTS